MDHIIAAQTEAEFRRYHAVSQNIQSKLESFIIYLETEYAVTSLPNAIVWTSREIATHSISNIPLPGYTNEFRTVFCPDLDTWREIYLHQLDDAENEDVRRYYEARLTENHILQILGHEFVHHSDLFIDEAYDKARWFEEGMCEYISRKYVLTEAEFAEAVHTQTLLVQQFQNIHGSHPLESFDASTYTADYAAIFHEYWRSFLAVSQIVDRFHGDIHAVFSSYHEWYHQGCTQSLSEWFQISI